MAINYQGGNDAVITGAFAPMMKTLQQNYLYEQQKSQEDRKQAEALRQQASKELAKVNSSGIWKTDLPEFTQKYQQLKDTYFQANRATNPSQRLELYAKLNEELSELGSFVENSKGVGEMYNRYMNGLPSLAGKGNVEKARAHAQQALGKKSSELSRDFFDQSQFLYKYDPTKVDSAISKVATDLLRNTPEQRVRQETITGSGGKRTDIWRVTQAVDENSILDNISRLARGGNRDVQNYVQDVMDNEGVDFTTAVAQVAEEYKTKFMIQKTENLSADKSKGVTVNVNTGNQGFTEPVNSIVDNYVIARAKQDIKTESGVTPKGGEVALKNYLQFNQTQDVGGILKGVDPETGKSIEAEGYSNKARVLGLGTDQQGRIYGYISYEPEYGETKTMLINADRYLNTSQITKTKKAYVEELVNRGVKLQGQSNQSNTNRQTPTKNPTPSKGLAGGTVR